MTQNQELTTVNVKGLTPINMGSGDVFGRMTPEGRLQAVMAPVALSEKQGEFIEISGRTMTTAKGFQKLNQVASVSIITPEKLTLPDGKIVVNPYPIIDPGSGTISKVWVRKTAIGYSPIGNLIVTQASLLYDVNMYFIQDCYKKIMYNADAGELCDRSDAVDKKGGKFLAIEGDMGVWVNYKNKDIMKVISTFINKKQFAERNAQTICERLVMSKHPALSFSFIDEYLTGGQEGHRYAKIPVWGYVNNFTKEQLLQIAAQAESGQEIVVGGVKVEVQEVQATVEEILQMQDQEQEHDELAAQPNDNGGVRF